MASFASETFYQDAVWTPQAGVTNVTARKIQTALPILASSQSTDSAGAGTALIDANNNLYAWGSNTCGRNGIGSVTGTCIPGLVCSGTKFASVAVAGNNVYAITTAGQLYAWGENNSGALGLGSTTSQCLPQLVCTGVLVRTIVANFSGTSTNSAFMITSNADLFGVGDNSNGHLANGNATSQCSFVQICAGTKFRYVQTSGFTTLAITAACGLLAAGSNFCGMLGIGSVTAQCTFQTVCSGLAFKCVSIATTSAQTSAVAAITSATRSLYLWGNNASGQLGLGNINAQCLPQLVCCGIPIKAVVNTGSTVFVLTESGILLSAGANTNGILGIGSTTNQCTFQIICSGTQFKSIISDGNSAFALTVCGQVLSWGQNSSGILGIGNATNQCLPQLVCSGLIVNDLLPITPNNSIQAYGTVWFVAACGAIYGIGINQCGQLGNSSLTSVCVPTLLCCSLKISPTLSQPTIGQTVVPGSQYAVNPLGGFPQFDNAYVANDPFTEALRLEYFY